MNINPFQQTVQITQGDPDENAFVIRQDECEISRVAFPQSIIRRFYTCPAGYVLLFQCRSSILREKGNLCLVSPAGEILWWAERRKSDDCYVEVRLEGDYVVGYDGSYECWIDIRKGTVQKREFVK